MRSYLRCIHRKIRDVILCYSITPINGRKSLTQCKVEGKTLTLESRRRFAGTSQLPRCSSSIQSQSSIEFVTLSLQQERDPNFTGPIVF